MKKTKISKIPLPKKYTKKPFFLIRLFTRLIIEQGYMQQCKGYIKINSKKINSKKIGHVLFYSDYTKDATSTKLRQLVTDAFKDGFRPQRYTSIRSIESRYYAPVWSKDYWKIKNNISLFANLCEILFVPFILSALISILFFILKT